MPTVGGQDKLSPSGEPHMSDRNLRSSLIRLASEHPEFRGDLLPLLKEAGNPLRKHQGDPTPNSERTLPLVESDFRHPFYEMSDGVGSTGEVIKSDPLLKKDAKLKGLMKALNDALDDMSRHMTDTYRWD